MVAENVNTSQNLVFTNFIYSEIDITKSVEKVRGVRDFKFPLDLLIHKIVIVFLI